MSNKVCENVVRVSNSLDPYDLPSYSASHPDTSLFAHGHFVVLGGQRDKANFIARAPVKLACLRNKFTEFNHQNPNMSRIISIV